MPIKKTIPTRSWLVQSDYSNEVFALTVWSNIFHWRKYKWISQQELSKQANITQASISEIENWDGNPTIETLNKIAQALSIKTELLTKNRLVRKMIEAVEYMSHSIKDLDVLKAMKLLYFTDLESLHQNWNKLIWLSYIRRNRWPFNQDIYQLNDIFPKDKERYQPCNFQTYLTLSNTDINFLNKIIKKYGEYPWIDLMDQSYETPPMNWFKKWDNKWMGQIIL